jgi:hypothetical protein
MPSGPLFGHRSLPLWILSVRDAMICRPTAAERGFLS